MGSALSRFRLALQYLRELDAAYQDLSNRIAQTPGLPVSEPSTSYWAIPPSPIAQHGCDATLSIFADVVIIGSGITGTAVARTLLENDSTLQIVMLEARDACSGATSRNGGHITPVLYHEYPELKKQVGAEMAKSLVKFRLAHIAELIRISKEEDILTESQCREVETFDVFFDQGTFDSAICNLTLYLEDIPDQQGAWRVVGKEECITDLQFSPTAVGAIATTAGAIHPYRFTADILSRLIARHPSNFHLFTHTPCLSISSRKNESLYTISTPKGKIGARHIVHATNGWASHLLPPMRGKIIPARGHMSCQRPGMGLGRPEPAVEPAGPNESVVTLTESRHSWLGTRSFVMYGGGRSYDYLTQQPSASAPQSRYPSPSAEFMFGGGAARGELGQNAFMRLLGIADDRGCDFDTAAYLSGALSTYFSGQWGAEGRDDNDACDVEAGRVKKLWTGILGISADGRPWVGRLPAKLSGRPVPGTQSREKHRLAPPGEWIAAGYTGEGMVHAYLSGKAVACMLLSLPTDELPQALLVTVERWKKANIEDMA